MSSTKELRERIIASARIAVEELIKIAKEPIINHSDETPSLAADRLKNAAATKRLVIFDALDILSRIDSEEELLNSEQDGPSKTDTKQGFAERRSR
jgi:hypothetical protein